MSGVFIFEAAVDTAFPAAFVPARAASLASVAGVAAAASVVDAAVPFPPRAVDACDLARPEGFLDLEDDLAPSDLDLVFEDPRLERDVERLLGWAILTPSRIPRYSNRLPGAARLKRPAQSRFPSDLG